jgi:dTDP-4-dehydrorhamnose 3,5-epimerase-like enzyme
LLDECLLLNLKKFGDRRGFLTPIDQDDSLPFTIRRLFYLYDIPGGADRGGHAHKTCHQLIVAVLGSFEVVVTDGSTNKTFRLDRASTGLYIPPSLWSSLVNFSSGAICLVLTSELFDESDYIRDFSDYLKFRTLPQC